MTLTNQQIHPSDKTKLFNRFMYGAFVMSSLYFAFVSKDLMAAMSNFGIALIFDPFDQKIMWNNRPLYQRVWLLVHLCILFGLISFLIFQYFRR